MTRKLTLRIMLLTGLWGAYTSQTGAQKKRSMDQCMEYAICHAHRIQKGQMEAENAELNAERARGAFIPSLNAGVGGQLSWGRNVDPETNTNNTVTALNNSYEELQLAQDVVAKRRHWLRQEKLYAESLIPHEDYLRAEAEERRHIASMPGTKAERKDVSLVLADQACRNRRGEDHSSRSFFIGLPETDQKRVFDENRGVGNRQKAVFDAIHGRRSRQKAVFDENKICSRIEREQENGFAVRTFCQFQARAARLHDACGQAQSDAGTAVLCAEEGHKPHLYFVRPY